MMRVQGGEKTHFALSWFIAGGKCSSQQRQVFADLVQEAAAVKGRSRDRRDDVRDARDGLNAQGRIVDLVQRTHDLAGQFVL